MKYIIISLLILFYIIYIAPFIFNNVNAWASILLTTVLALLIINFLINQIKKTNK